MAIGRHQSLRLYVVAPRVVRWRGASIGDTPIRECSPEWLASVPICRGLARETALVACFGLLPAAMSTGIGSDSQKPFAIVIVAGLASRLLLSIFLSPVLYSLAARDGDTLQV